MVVMVVSLFQNVPDFSGETLFAGRVPVVFLRQGGLGLSFGGLSFFPANSAEFFFRNLDPSMSPTEWTDRVNRLPMSAGSPDKLPGHGCLRISTCFAAIAAKSASIFWSDRRLCHSISISSAPSRAVSLKTPVDERV